MTVYFLVWNFMYSIHDMRIKWDDSFKCSKG